MGKYQELVEGVKKASQTLNVLKTKISQDFVAQLANAWGCEKDCITVEFEKPEYAERNKLITWGFNLEIKIIAPTITITLLLNDFSLGAIKDSKMDSPITIKYKDKFHNSNEPIEDFSDAIFEEIRKRIEGCSWF